jgi:hypothetical protein
LFVQRAGREPSRVVSQLPRKLRLERVDQYPPAAQERLAQLGLAEAIVLEPTESLEGGTGARRRDALMWGCVIATVCVMAILLVAAGLGLAQMGRELWRLVR